MAILGTTTNRTNPEDYNMTEFLVWFPEWEKYLNTELGTARFNRLKEMANKKIFYSIWGQNWYLATSLFIAHYFYIIYMNNQEPGGDSLASIAGGGATKGMLTSASVGGFSKGYSLEYTAVNLDDAKFWNYSSYGAQLMALYKTIPVASMFVVTNGPVPPSGGNGNYFRGGSGLYPWRNRRGNS